MLKVDVYPFARSGEGLRRKREKRGKKGNERFWTADYPVEKWVKVVDLSRELAVNGLR